MNGFKSKTNEIFRAVNLRMLQLVVTIVILVLFVLAAGAPGGMGGVGMQGVDSENPNQECHISLTGLSNMSKIALDQFSLIGLDCISVR